MNCIQEIMSHGGKRPGAGRPKGSSTRMNEEARKQALADGISPLDYMLGILRDDRQPPDTRFEAAKAAAPYVHARLAAVEHKGEMTVRNVARLPEPARDAQDWSEQYAPKPAHH